MGSSFAITGLSDCGTYRNGHHLQDKLKQAQQAQTEERIANSVDNKRMPSVSTENLLSRVNNSGPVEKESNMYGKISKSGAKLHQLMDKGSRPDAVAAS